MDPISAAFGALADRRRRSILARIAAGAPIWIAIILYTIGVVSCWVACVIVAAFYMGSIYRMVNLALAALSFIVFSVWPKAGGVMYGWFFNLFT